MVVVVFLIENWHVIALYASMPAGLAGAGYGLIKWVDSFEGDL